MLNYPRIASRSCQDCATYVYNEDGTPTMRAGIHQKRPQGMPTPCHTCPKIPTGVMPVPENALELTPRLARAYRHYRGCKAVGRFPIHPHGEDEIVVDNARIIAGVERIVEVEGRKRLELVMASVFAVAGGSAGGGA